MALMLSPLRLTLAIVALLGSTGCHHHGCDDDDDRGRGREGRRDRDRDDNEDEDDGDRCRRPCDNDNNNDNNNNNGGDAGPGTAVDTGVGAVVDTGVSSAADAGSAPADTGPRTPQGCFSDRDCAEGSVCRGGACRATCPNGTDAECLRVDVVFAYCGTDRLCTSQRP